MGKVSDRSSDGSNAIVGSGVPASQAREVPPFRGVELAGSNTVTIRVGGEQSVVVHADDNLIDTVTTDVSGGSLVIGNRSDGVTIISSVPMRVDVTVPEVDVLTLSGSGTIEAAGIATDSATVALPGSGIVNAGGRVDRLDVTLAGSGDAQLSELVAADVRAVVTGSGRILVNATETLDASVPGAGSIVYTGAPEHVKQRIDGVGSVTRG